MEPFNDENEAEEEGDDDDEDELLYMLLRLGTNALPLISWDSINIDLGGVYMILCNIDFRVKPAAIRRVVD